MILLEAFQPYLHHHCPPVHTLVAPPVAAHPPWPSLPLGKQYLDIHTHFTLSPLACLHRWLVYHLLVDDPYDPHCPVRQVIRYHFTCMAPKQVIPHDPEDKSLIPSRYPEPFSALSNFPMIIPIHPEATALLSQLTLFCEQYEAWQYRRVLHHL